MKDEIEHYIREKYGIEPEHPWAKYPENTTFKAAENDYAGVTACAGASWRWDGGCGECQGAAGGDQYDRQCGRVSACIPHE